MSEQFVCYLCGAKQAEKIYSEKQLALNCVTAAPGLAEDSFDYYVCAECGTIAQFPMPTEETLKQYYVAGEPIIHADMPNAYEFRKNFIVENVPLRAGRALDLGAADGGFLFLIRNHMHMEVLGVEASEHAVKLAKEKFDITLLNMMLEEIDLRDEAIRDLFDLVIFSHVLEHLPNPARALEKIVTLVKPGGYLYLEIPSAERTGSLITVPAFARRIVNKLHLSHFSAFGLSHALTKLGLTVIEQQTGPDQFLHILARNLPIQAHMRDVFGKMTHLLETYTDTMGIYLRDLLKQHARIAFWGAGTDLYDLLFPFPHLRQDERFMLVDANPAKHGKTLLGMPIHPPAAVANVDLVIITPLHPVLADNIYQGMRQLFPDVKSLFLYAISHEMAKTNE